MGAAAAALVAWAGPGGGAPAAPPGPEAAAAAATPAPGGSARPDGARRAHPARPERGGDAPAAPSPAPAAAEVADLERRAERAYRAGDVDAALDLFERAAARGSLDARYNLGSVAHARGDAAAARRWLEPAARAGHARSAFDLAVLLEQGRGGPPDLDRAAELYRAAVAAGDAGAMTNLARLLLDGRVAETAPGEAADLLRRAAAAGKLTHLANLAKQLAAGRIPEREPGETTAALERAARLGDAECAYLLARRRLQAGATERGLAGLSALGEGGLLAAQRHLADLYRRGREGVRVDAAAAERWARRAAASDDPAAAVYLGDVLMEPVFAGEASATPERLSEVRALFLRGAEAGDGMGMVRLAELDLMYAELAPPAAAERLRAGALDWLRRAEAAGGEAAATARKVLERAGATSLGR